MLMQRMSLTPGDPRMGIRINDTAPNFTAQTTEGEIDFHEWIGDSWAVLFSHPKNFTPVCTTELGYMASVEGEFAKRGVKVIGLSVDHVDKHEAWADDIEETQGHRPNYPIIGDSDYVVAKLYDMLPAEVEGDSGDRTPMDNLTVRNSILTGRTAKTGTGITAGAMPAKPTAPVLAATPAWVAIAGPVGWTLAGVGALAIPFAYRSAKLKQKDQMEAAALDHIKGVFRRIRSEQVPTLRRMGTRILGDFRDRLDNELLQIEQSLNAAMARKQSNTGTAELERLASRLDRLMQEAAGWA